MSDINTKDELRDKLYALMVENAELKRMIKDHTPREAAVVKVIRVVFTRGDGVRRPIREVVQFWTMDGQLLAEDDPCPDDVEER